MAFSNVLKNNAISATGSTETGSYSGLWKLFGKIWRGLNLEDPITHRYLLLLRFAVANMIAFALVGAAIVQGWVGSLLAAEGSSFSVAIAAVFAAGLLWSAQRATEISRELNNIERFKRFPLSPAPTYLRQVRGRKADSRAIYASSLKLRLASRVAPIRHLANSLVLLGLVGTVIGFIVALSGVEPDAASDVGAVGPMISTLINGMSIALHTTLVGSLLHIWLMVNVRLLEGGTVKLLAGTIELGEAHADA